MSVWRAVSLPMSVLLSRTKARCSPADLRGSSFLENMLFIDTYHLFKGPYTTSKVPQNFILSQDTFYSLPQAFGFPPSNLLKSLIMWKTTRIPHIQSLPGRGDQGPSSSPFSSSWRSGGGHGLGGDSPRSWEVGKGLIKNFCRVTHQFIWSDMVKLWWEYIAYWIYGPRFCPKKIDHIGNKTQI